MDRQVQVISLLVEVLECNDTGAERKQKQINVKVGKRAKQ